MPLISSIKTSIYNKDFLIRDSHAKNGDFLRKKNGDLISYAGGYTVVYPYMHNNEKWGFRCWHAEMGNIRSRFDKISKTISSIKVPYLCDFIYVDEGIVVDGKIYPTTRMQWVAGENLKEFILRNINSKSVLLKLAEDFLSISMDMHKRRISHGDLQHENIVVKPNGSIVYIDYDSFFCPELTGESDYIVGKDNYQHPARKKNKITSEKIDYFSELVIYTTILALAYASDLAKKYRLDDPDSTLFKADDFKNIKQSTIYSDLQKIGGIFKTLLLILEDYLRKSSIDELEPFDVLLDGLEQVPKILEFKSDRNKILIGDSCKIRWKAEPYTTVLLNGKDVTKTNFKTFKISTSTKFELKVYNGHKCATKTINVVTLPKPTISFSSNRSLFKKTIDTSVDLSWRVENSKNITLLANGVIIDDGCISEYHKELKINETTEYQLKVVALDGQTIFTKNLNVSVIPESTFTFEADKEYVLPRVPITLSWKVQNAKTVLIDGKKVNSEGRKIIDKGIDKDKTYTISVTDAFGTKTKSIKVKILPNPRLESIIVPIPDIQHTITSNIQINLPKISIEPLTMTVEGVKLQKEWANVLSLNRINIIDTNTLKTVKGELSTSTPSIQVYWNNILDKWSRIREKLIRIWNQRIK